MMQGSRGCILFATMEFHPTNPGGAGILVHHTVSVLLEKGYEIVLLFDGGRTEGEKLVAVDRLGIPYAHRLQVHLIDELCEDLVIDQASRLDIAIVKSLRLNHALGKLTKKYKVDLIELYDYCGHGYHYLSQPPEDRPPVATRLHSTIELMERSTRAALVPERLWLYALERAQLLLSDAVLTPGPAYFAKNVQPLYPALNPERVLESSPVHQSIGQIEYDDESRDVVFYGRLTTLKGLDTFLRAAILALEDPAFDRWLGRFLVIGPEDHVISALGPNELNALLPKNKAKRFEFTGRLDHAGLLDRLRGAAFACFANRVESFCYAAHELHTAGVPLIVNTIPAFEDGFEDEVGAVFFDGTAFDLARRMTQLARDSELRRRLSLYGKERAPSYWQDRYAEHLAWLGNQQRGETRVGGVSGSAVILSTGDRRSVAQTVASLSKVGLTVWVLELDPEGDLDFAGRRWRGVVELSGTTSRLAVQSIGDVCLFLRAGDSVDPEWVRQALRVLAQMPIVGAVGGWVRRHSGIETMGYLLVPELARADEPGLRVLFRTPGNACFGEYLHGWSSQSERSYLLEHRAAGRVAIELPRLAVDAREAVNFPAVADTAFASEFDRFSREFLAVAGAANAVPSRLDPGADDVDVAATKLTSSLVVIRTASANSGELWVLGLWRDDGRIDFDWSSVVQQGDWEDVVAPDAPAGVRMTRCGSLRFHAFCRTGIEMLFGPFCGACEIVHRGRVHAVSLKQPAAKNRTIWLDELAREDRPSRAIGDGKLAFTTIPVLQPEHAALEKGGFDVMAIAPRNGSGIASMLRFHPRTCVLNPEDLGPPSASSPLEGAAYALQVLRRTSCQTLAIDTDLPEGAELAEGFLRNDGNASVVALLGEQAPLGIGGAMAVYRGLGSWLRLGARFPRRLIAASRNPALCDFVSQCGLRALTIPSRMPPIGKVENGETPTVEVVVAGGTGTVSNITHMIAGVSHARRTGLNISRLWLPSSDELAITVARRLDAAPVVEVYVTLQEVFKDAQRHIMLDIFPDSGDLPEAARFALSAGCLPILGPGSVFSRWPAFHDSLCVTYWEDAIEIAERLNRTAEIFDHLTAEYERLRAAQDEIIEAGLTALVAGSLPSAAANGRFHTT